MFAPHRTPAEPPGCLSPCSPLGARSPCAQTRPGLGEPGRGRGGSSRQGSFGRESRNISALARGARQAPGTGAGGAGVSPVACAKQKDQFIVVPFLFLPDTIHLSKRAPLTAAVLQRQQGKQR